LKLTRQPEDITTVIQRAVTAVQAQAVAKGLAVTTDLANDLPLCDIDPGRIGQVLRNLLNNAVTPHQPWRHHRSGTAAEWLGRGERD